MAKSEISTPNNISLKVCPRCGQPSQQWMSLESGMRLALQMTGVDMASLPQEVCPGCFAELGSNISEGARLRIQQKERAKNLQMLWKSRVNLVKRARQLMEAKAYAEAAANYEKYIRVLEITHDLDKGTLTPEVFGKSQHSRELTVVASVYLDLLRIYDSSSVYRPRMQDAAKRLAQFAPFSTIYPDIVRKAEQFQRNANNADIVNEFLRHCRRTRPNCFIATAVFHAPYAPELFELRWFRDEVLSHYRLGRFFILKYYRHSPPIARWLEASPRAQRLVRYALRSALRLMKLFLNLEGRTRAYE